MRSLPFQSFAAVVTWVLLAPSSSADWIWPEEMKLVAGDGAAVDVLGYGVAISDGLVLVGCHGDDDNGCGSGSAYLFDAATGEQLRKLTPLDGAAGDIFGRSGALSGGLALVGARLDDDNGSGSGSAYLFDATTGLQLHKLTPTGGAAEDHFGESVSLSGSLALIGAKEDDDNGTNSGSAYVFDAGTGQQLLELQPSDGEANWLFGHRVSLSGGLALIAAPGDDYLGVQSGSAYLFDVVTGQQLAKLTAQDGAAGDRFGESISLSGAQALVGAPRNDAVADNAGAAYLYPGHFAVYVDWTNTGGPWNGSAAHPYRTLAEGYAGAGDGHWIVLHSGSYPETGVFTKRLELHAENGPVTVGF